MEIDRDKRTTRKKDGHRGHGENVFKQDYHKLEKLSKAPANLGEHFKKGDSAEAESIKCGACLEERGG